MTTPDHPAHAKHNASSAGAWLNCPAYIQIKTMLPDESSADAEAGTLAHKIAELKARKFFIEGIGPRKFTSMMKKLKEDPRYTPEMDEATDMYLDALKEQALTFDQPPVVFLETRVDYGDIAPDGFGTADCLMFGDDTLVVADYKNGAGVAVEAEHNPQLKIYAYAAVQNYKMIYGDAIQKIRLIIVQPHNGGVKVWETTFAELMEWIQTEVVPAVARTMEENPPAIPGDWCETHFCPGQAQCRARAEAMFSIADKEGAEPAGGRQPSEVAAYEAAREINPSLPPLLTDDEVGEILIRAKSLIGWAEKLKEYAFRQMMAGKRIPGWKLVLGNKSRSWEGGQDAAFQTLMERGVPEAMLYVRNPVTPPMLQKVLGKKEYDEKVEDLVHFEPGKPMPVEASNKKPEWIPAEAAFRPVEEDPPNV